MFTSIGAQITSRDDAGFVKESSRSIAAELRTINSGDNTLDEAAGSAPDHAVKVASLVDDIVDGGQDSTERSTEAIVAFSADFAKIRMACEGLL